MFKIVPEGLLVEIHAQPNSSKNEIVGLYNGSLKIKINAPPVDGKANKQLQEFLAKALNLSKSSISIEKGDTGRKKKS